MGHASSFGYYQPRYPGSAPRTAGPAGQPSYYHSIYLSVLKLSGRPSSELFTQCEARRPSRAAAERGPATANGG
ncbi:hypothetical protein GCM10027422_33290 [Hymenobacter arcticus]